MPRQSPLKNQGGLAYLTSEELRAVDDEAIGTFGIDILSLMENAGAGTATLARRMMGGAVAGKRVACLVGKGNNGGDGLVAARHLRNWGAEVALALGSGRADFVGIPGRQLAAAEKMKIPVVDSGTALSGADLVIDALLGYNSKGDPRGPVADLIRRANDAVAPVLALDIPSGLDPTTGSPNNPCIRATATVTLGFPKTGFLNPVALPFIGELYLCDISLPGALYRKYSQREDLFAADFLVKLVLPS